MRFTNHPSLHLLRQTLPEPVIRGVAATNFFSIASRRLIPSALCLSRGQAFYYAKTAKQTSRNVRRKTQ